MNLSGPMLIAANHPNSFLDAIILSSLFKKPIYSLARGDAFTGNFIKLLLTSLNMLPVYRITEGAANLDKNYDTFNACQHLFKKNEIVLIFSEGRCINEWHLRPLKKGTARLALTAWMQNIPLKVLPLGINYSSLKKFGKIVKLDFGQYITPNEIHAGLDSGKAIFEFNRLLEGQLKELVIEAHPGDITGLKKIFNTEPPPVKKALLMLPAAAGYVLHAPIYFGTHFLIRNISRDHYDSVMVGIFFLFYPLYLILIVFLLLLFTGSWYSFLLILIMPLTALALLHVKNVFGMGHPEKETPRAGTKNTKS